MKAMEAGVMPITVAAMKVNGFTRHNPATAFTTIICTVLSSWRTFPGQS